MMEPSDEQRQESVPMPEAAEEAKRAQTLEELRTAYDLDTEGVAILPRVLFEDAPFDPPEALKEQYGASHRALVDEHAKLRGLLDSQKKNPSPERRQLVVRMVREYGRKLTEYETACRAPFVPALRNTLGLPRLNDEEFRTFLEDVRRPIPADDFSGNHFNQQQQEFLIRDHAAILQSRAQVVADLDAALDNLRYGYPLESSEVQDIHVGLADFLKRRWRHRAEVARKEPIEEKWMQYLGVVFAEAAEESAEHGLAFGKESVFQKFVPGLKSLDAGFMRTLQAPAQKVGEILRARGIQAPPSLQEVMSKMAAGPFGKEFWQKLLTIESPVTVLLYAYFLHMAPNKAKATMQFASFLANSAVTNELLTLGGNWVAQSRLGLGTTALVEARCHAGLVKVMRSAPPAIKFVALLAVMLNMQPLINKYVIDPLDEAWDDNDFKHSFGEAMGVLSGESILGSVPMLARETGLPQEMGLLRLDPDREQLQFLGEEYLTDNDINPLRGLDRRFLNSIADWNDHVRAEIKRENNPALARLWKEQIIEDREAWSKRMAATDLFPAVQFAAGMERSILEQLRARPNVPIGKDEALGALDIATADSDSWTQTLQSEYTGGRNDRAFEYLLDTEGQCIARVHAYMKRLGAEDPLRKEWETYLAQVRAVAKKVALFRHLQVYDRGRWLNDRQELSAFLQDGLIEEIVHQQKRDRALRFDPSSGESASTHARNIATAIDVEGPTPGVLEAVTSKVGAFGSDVVTGKILTDIASPDAGAFGDKRLNERQGLSAVGQSAGSILPKERQNEAQAGLRRLATDTEVVGMDAMRSEHDALAEAVSAHVSKSADIVPAPNVLLQALKVPAGVTALYQINRDISEDLAAANMRVFNGLEGPKSGDVVLFQYVAPPQGAAVMTRYIIHPEGPETRDWTVDILRYTIAGTARGQGAQRAASESGVPFERWRTEQPAFFASLNNGTKDTPSILQQAIDRRLQEVREAQNQAKIRATRERSVNELQREKALSQSATFIRAGSDYWTRYGDKVVLLTPQQEQKSYRAVPSSGTLRHDPEDHDYFRFQLRFNPDKSVDPWIVRSLDYHTEKNLTEDQKKLITDLLTTPLEDDPEATVQRLINLRPRESYRPDSLGALFYSPRYYARELKDAVVPLYKNARDKKAFLCTLIDALRTYDVINEQAVREIPKALAA